MPATLQDALNEYVQELRSRPYAALASLVGQTISRELATDRGAIILQTLIRWDDADAGHVRVIVNADDGGLRAFVPLSESFIMRPDGRFEGE